MSRFVDLSHTLSDGLVTYPGLPAPVITDFLSREESKQRYAAGTTFHIARIEMVANSGTYVDATSAGRAIDERIFRRDVRRRAVLIRTGWSRHFGTPAYGSGHPYLTAAAA